ncbi:MAG TPA: hypothetical protein PKO22_06455 [Treponemataceae bacterium]|nr:hypothetical protein [Treponemataceae bacterium]
MKKFFIAAIALSLIASVSAFADGANADYQVDKVVGKVEREVSPGKWEPVVGAMKLDPKSIVNVGLNSSLVIKVGERTVTVKAMQKGTVEQLTSVSVAAKPSIKIGAKATKSTADASEVKGRTNISTASTRASDATNDIEWEE